jgi:hypothetical protein
MKPYLDIFTEKKIKTASDILQNPSNRKKLGRALLKIGTNIIDPIQMIRDNPCGDVSVLLDQKTSQLSQIISIMIAIFFEIKITGFDVEDQTSWLREKMRDKMNKHRQKFGGTNPKSVSLLVFLYFPNSVIQKNQKKKMSLTIRFPFPCLSLSPRLDTCNKNINTKL